MTTMRIHLAGLAAAVLTLSGSAPDVALQSTEIEGTWTGWFGGSDDDRRDRIRLQRWDDDRWQSGTTLPEGVVAELLRQARANDGVVRYTLTREAGSIELVGRVSDERGRGTFTFREDPSFRDAMEALGFGRLDGGEVFAAAVHDVGSARVGELRSMGFDPDWGDVMASAIFDVGPAFAQEMREAGLDRMSLGDLVAFRVHDITPAYVAGARSLGLGGLDQNDIVAMKIHDIDAGFVGEARAMGFRDIDFDDVIAMKIHGVDRDFVDGLAAEGVALDNLDEVMAFRIHDITPEYVRQLKAEGFEDLDPDELLKIRIHGLDRILAKRRRR